MPHTAPQDGEAQPAPRIREILSHLRPVAAARPWPRYDIDAPTWDAVSQALGGGEGDLLGLWCAGDAVNMALRIAADDDCVIVSTTAAGGYPSVGRHHPPAILLERAIRDVHGYDAMGAPGTRPWLDHGAWQGPSAGPKVSAAPDYEFLPVTGDGLHQVSLGPIHGGVSEPGHFRLTVNGETIVRLESRLGYAHRGIERLLAGSDIDRAGRIVARVSGDSTVAASFAFAMAAEAALDIIVPPRAHVLRGVMAELERVGNHLGDLAAICNAASFAVLHARFATMRERLLGATDRVFAHRLMMDEIMPGGVAQDLNEEGVAILLAVIGVIETEFASAVRLYDDTPSLHERMARIGTLSRDLVTRWGAGGPIGRASGRSFDARRDLAYPPYTGLSFAVPVLPAGDVDARVRTRIAELDASIAIIRHCLAALPSGPVLAPYRDASETREGVAVTESFRGDLLVWLRLAPGRKVIAAHVRDASWFAWPLLEAAVQGDTLADVPLVSQSFNCSIAGVDL